jgi:hypothetical protein
MESRRQFLSRIIMTPGALALGPEGLIDVLVPREYSEDPSCTLYRAVNGSPRMNLSKVIEIMGGIEKIIGSDHVVVIKPNAQWWNQGAPSLAALKGFVDLIMNRPGGFKGEVALAENCHRSASPWREGGWARNFEQNSDLPQIHNMNDLARDLKKKYGNRFSICHWIDVKRGGKRVYGPNDGDGYVYCDGTGGVPLIKHGNGARGWKYKETIMTYPIFSTDKGTIIDFKNGIWEGGSYTGQPLRFINFSPLNHHSTYCGVTSAVKNYLGITDLSGGPDPNDGGRLTDHYFNFHSFPFDKWAPGPRPGMLGAEVGVFLKTIRKADLNITTAEWIGLSSRTTPPIAHPRAVLACTDPVALDYHASKYVLFPNSGLSIHNPDLRNRPLRDCLMKCTESFGGILDEKRIDIKSFDFRTEAFQKDTGLTIIGKKKWGSVRNIVKYLILKWKDFTST